MKQWTCGYAVENMWRSLWENVRRRALTLAETMMRMRTKKTTRTRSCQSCVNRTNSSSNQLTGSHGRRE
jgi:pyruvoyl-dependent arginine decarboxylase (PvlArgDC)